jgi:hypothetical protein
MSFSPGRSDAVPNVIRSLRLPDGALAGDSLAARLRMEALLQNVVLSPPGLPPTALLVVDHLQDRRLARMLSAGPSNHLPSSLVVGWERAFTSCLKNLAEQAARPLRGPVPPGSPAVLFLDEPELLACLALDLLNGQAASQWWWKAVFPTRNYRDSLVRELEDSPMLIPPVIEHLARRGQSVPFAHHLGESTCLQLARSVLSTYHLGALTGLLAEEMGDVESSSASWKVAERPAFRQNRSGQVEGEGSPESLPLPARAPAGPLASAKLQSLLDAFPESRTSGLSMPGRILLAVSLNLSRAPAALRALASTVNRAVPPSSISSPSPAALPGTAASPQPADSPPGGSPSGQSQTAGLTAGPDQAGRAVANSPIEIPNERAILQPEALSFTHTRVSTHFGGLFYLLNLAVYMGIYSDFTGPVPAGWALSPWDLLALLGRHWLAEPLLSDPLWPLLARLSGRQDEPGQVPAGDHAIQESTRWFSPPPGWLESLDLAAAGPPTPDELSLAGSSWLLALASVMRRRLALAFGHDHPLDMLIQPAQVWVSATRLDIHFDLASHPLEVRLSGLDRDLGWLPDAGISVYYHYDL